MENPNIKTITWINEFGYLTQEAMDFLNSDLSEEEIDFKTAIII